MERQTGVGIFQVDRVPRLKKGEGLSGVVWAEARSIVVNDYNTWSGRHPATGDLVNAMLCVPLGSESRVTGVLGLATERGSGRTFSQQDLANLERFAPLASLALENARLYDEAVKARETAEILQAANIALTRISLWM